MNGFHLQILTPARMFFEDTVEALTFTTTDGEWTILAGHIPFSAPLVVGSIRICQDGTWREAFQSEGFMEFDHEGAHVFVQACEWPEEIDAARALQAEQRARSRLSDPKNPVEVEWTRIALTRAMRRLQISHHKLQ